MKVESSKDNSSVDSKDNNKKPSITQKKKRRPTKILKEKWKVVKMILNGRTPKRTQRERTPRLKKFVPLAISIQNFLWLNHKDFITKTEYKEKRKTLILWYISHVYVCIYHNTLCVILIQGTPRIRYMQKKKTETRELKRRSQF